MLMAECILALQNSLGNGVLGQCLVEMISIGGSTEVGTAPAAAAAAAGHRGCRGGGGGEGAPPPAAAAADHWRCRERIVCKVGQGRCHPVAAQIRCSLH